MENAILPTTADGWNRLMRQTAAENNIDLEAEAKKANLPGDRGVMVPTVTPARATVTTSEPEDEGEVVIYKQTFEIGGKPVEFEGASPEEVMLKVSAALRTLGATQQTATTTQTNAPDPAAEAKRKEQEMFDIGLKLQQGDVTAIDAYLEKSGAIDKYFETRGIKISELKDATTERQTSQMINSWDTATKTWLGADGNDYPGGEQNRKLLGYKLVEMGLAYKPSAESLQRAYDALKADGMIFPGQATGTSETTTTTTKRRATSSTMTGTGIGERETTQQTQGKIVSITEKEWESMGPQKQAIWYNNLVTQGYKPEQIVVKR